MQTFILRRLTKSPTAPTYGVLLCSDVPQCVTLELPAKDNQVDLSCILAGTYTVLDNQNPLKPFRLQNVPGRTEVDMHAGNTVHDTLGCILLGTSFFPGGIEQSGAALKLFQQVAKTPFTLIIMDPAA